MPIESASAFSSRPFDYLIVGGGTSGLTLAARLSENPNVTVGVLEAGEWDDSVPEINIPAFCGSLIGNPKYDWMFMSTPQADSNQRAILQPRGKALGGSSLMHLLANNRASSAEYDAIEALGNKGWGWEEWLKYMKKSETTLPLAPEVAKQYSIESPIDPAYHGDSGPIKKSYPIYHNALQLKYYETFQKLGIPSNPDGSKGDNVGFVTSYTTVDPVTATRTYSANAHYKPNAERPNLILVTGAHVSKVLFDRPVSGDVTATGVEFISGDKKYTAKASKEVILSAGTFQTPQILELSGIGSKDVLSKHGIKQIIDLPGVGQNLQDHIYVYSIHEIKNTYDTLDLLADPAVIGKQFELYASQQGMLSSSSANFMTFMPAQTFTSSDKLKQWDSEFSHIPEKGAVPGTKKQFEFQRKWLPDPKSAQAELIPVPAWFFAARHQPPTPGCRYSSMVNAVMHPLSRGTVHISSADPLAPPEIDPAYFHHPLDLEILLNILKFTLKLYQTKPMAEVVTRQVMPSAEEASSDESLKEYIKNYCQPVYHPVGTASMTPLKDGGVVDPSLKVYGTKNLRIVDCSIIPIELSCHTQTLAYAIGEKAADIIRSS